MNDLPPGPISQWQPDPEDEFVLETVKSCGRQSRLSKGNYTAEDMATVAVKLWETLVYMGTMEMNDLIKSVAGPRRASLRTLYRMRDLRLVQTRCDDFESHFVFTWYQTLPDFANRVYMLAEERAAAIERRMAHEEHGIFSCGTHAPLSHDDAMGVKFRCPTCDDMQFPRETNESELSKIVLQLRS